MPKRIPITPAPPDRKAPESVVATTLAKLLGVPAMERVADVVEQMVTAAPHLPLSALVGCADELYPWRCDAARSVMEGSSPLLEHLVSRPGQAFVVSDTERSGADSLWLACADPPDRFLEAVRGMACRGLFRSVPLEGPHAFVVSIQLTSCIQK